MARLKENGMIDDPRYAKQFARQRTEGRKQGKFRVAHDLRARAVPDRHVEAALQEAAQETDEGVMVRQRIERKLRSFRSPEAAGAGTGKTIDEKKLASLPQPPSRRLFRRCHPPRTQIHHPRRRSGRRN